ncbi:MAG: rhomboid family intramembrane serine protease [Planctomycetota bacterium]|nr:rhomboid family intramembrane serine protease [Planctomycetota bacterium]
MLLLPYGTDAPVYHFPFGTIGLIVVNTFTFFVTPSAVGLVAGADAAPSLLLEFDTINPLQWLTNNFLHADLLHLVGNMLFLWVFGLVVEGKLGWWRFLTTYLLIGTAESAFVQTIMFFLSDGEGAALGASGAIYGLMAMALVWAPRNDIHCVWMISLIVRTVEIPILAFAAFYFGLQVVFFALRGFAMSSEALHVSGIFTGFPIGIFLLKRNMVDCEGWDAFTLYFANDVTRQKRQDRRGQRRAEVLREEMQERNDERRRIILALEEALLAANSAAAAAIYEKFGDVLQMAPEWNTRNLLGLMNALHQQKKWESSLPVMVRLLQNCNEQQGVPIRLKLAQILLKISDRPHQAMAVLKKLPPKITNEQLHAARQLANLAKAKLAAGSLEVDVQDW